MIPQNLPEAKMALTFSAMLSQLGIEECYQKTVSELSGGRIDYIRDVEIDDLVGKLDSNGERIPPAVARGIVRKLQACSMLGPDASIMSEEEKEEKQGTPSSKVDGKSSSVGGPCSLNLTQGTKDFSSLVRCSVRGRLDQDGATPMRRKVLTAVLDNSGSMMRHWPLVVDAVTKVFTDDLLSDPFISLKAVAYNTKAHQVTLPTTSSELSSLLLRKFSPGGITNFEAAFELAEVLIRNEVNKFADDGIPLSSIDVTTLIFTDGADTSVAPFGYVSDAASRKARQAGDRFKDHLRSLGCSAYTCVAAFGEYHDPEQCQYLSDRYYYINRREVLSDWLMGGLSDLLKSSGSCSLKVHLPSRLTLLEPLPEAIQLNSQGSFDYEIWLQDKAAGSATDGGDDITVCVEERGAVALSGAVSLSSAVPTDSDRLEGRLFLLDAGEMQLRQIALELRGRRPSPTELAMLRERLVGVQALFQPILDAASDPKAHISGRSLILSRVEELETRRNRLSYTLGHFEDEDHGDTRKIGAVGIDAVLRDVSQRVPLGEEASKYAKRAEAATRMGGAEILSHYGREVTFDPLSGCDAKKAAEQGDALFFGLSRVSFSSDGNFLSASDSLDPPVAHDVFKLLSNKKGTSSLQSLRTGTVQVGIPVYASAGHFERASLILPEVLEKLSGSFVRGKSERLLLDLLGQSLAAHLTKEDTSKGVSLALIHKARSVYEVFKSTKPALGAGSLLDEVLFEAKMFVENAEERKNTKNLYRLAASGLLAQDWPLADLAGLGEAIIEESIRRAIEQRLAVESMTARIQLAWALLGKGDGDRDWLGASLEDSEGNWRQGFDIVAVGPEMEDLERQSPGRYSPRDPGLLSDILRSSPPSGTPRAKEWSSLRTLLSQWGNIVDAETSNGGVWCLLDKVMVEDGADCEDALARFGAALQLGREAKTLGDVLPNPTEMLPALAAKCLEGLPSEEKSHAGPVRLRLASVTESLVREREGLARKYPIVGAAFPSLPHASRQRQQEVWGAGAYPVDKSLYDEVRRSVHRERWDEPLALKDALTDKRYRSRGGRFRFPTRLDTFVPGLHRRTRDLHHAWRAEKRQTGGPEARRDAVAEMLLRLPWDDRDDAARRKLSMIVGEIWDGLNGLPPGEPLASALWIDEGRPESGSAGECMGSNEDGEGWDVL